MSKNIFQVYTANPITSNAATDLMYFGQSPYGVGDDAAMTFADFASQFGNPYTPSALTKVDDTNITLTLGGTPSLALLQAVSLTLGWTGQLSPARGGSGVNNGTNTLTLGGNTAFSGAFTFTGTLTGNTSVTFPTSGTLATTSQIPSVTPSALTKADDTNVTLTLGGTPATSLLQAVSLTLGWTGQLSLGRGGSNANLTASNGGIVYSTATAMAILAGTATARQMLQSGATGAPAWSTATWPATTTINQLLYSSANNVVSGLSTQASSVLVTDSGGVPQWSTGLPAAVQGNITTVGTLTSNIRMGTGLALQTNTGAGNTLLLQAYDVDGAAYTTFATLTANNTPTFDLSTAVTIGGVALGPVTPWVAYTPTFTGFGTPSSVQIFSRRVGGSLQIRGNFTAGTSTAVEARMTLGFNGTNANVTSSGAFIGGIQVAGCGTISFPFAGSFQPLIEQSIGYITFGLLNAGTSGLSKATGNGFTGAGNIVSVLCDIPITGW